jgi:TetR/AcrR family transcriptional repressor of nem operon
VLPSLTAEVARAGDSVREIYQLRISRVVALVAPALPGDAEQQKQRAWTVVAAIVGAVSIARALPDGAHSRAVRDATLKSVEAMITQS